MLLSQEWIIVLSACVVILYLIVLWLYVRRFWARRHLFPINKRYPNLTLFCLASDTFLGVLSFFTATGAGDDFPCLISLTLYSIVVMSVPVLILGRLVCMLNDFERHAVSVPEPSWFHRCFVNARFARPSYWIRMWAAWTLFNASLWLLLYVVFASPSEWSSASCSFYSSGAVGVFAYSYAFLYLPLMGLVTMAIRRLWRFDEDALGLKTEMRFHLFGYVGVFVSLAGVIIFASSDPVVVDVLFIATMMLTFQAQIRLPLQRSHFYYLAGNEVALKTPRLPRLPSMKIVRVAIAPLLHLDAVLNTPSGFAGFLAHCRREFSSENPLFWQAVQEYKAIFVGDDSPVAALSRLNVIRQQYLEKGAPYEVNIGENVQVATLRNADFVSAILTRRIANKDRPKTIMTVESLDEASTLPSPVITAAIATSPTMTATVSLCLESVSNTNHNNALELRDASGVFNSAQKAVFSLMSSDTFMRFTESREYALLF